LPFAAVIVSVDPSMMSDGIVVIQLPTAVRT
jgi:hypothetical protein